jgi:hypothetical protein
MNSVLLACCLLHAGFLLHLLFNHEDGGDVPPKLRLIFTGLNEVLFQMTESSQSLPLEFQQVQHCSQKYEKPTVLVQSFCYFL